ncbi:MAG: hypothetical protein IPQ18_02730 [Saprospiraceae bacterium]|nr:hypothetical protein [Saprospiraceae bacterium]
MKTLLAVSLATIYGVSLRIMFGLLNNFMGIMSVSFLILAPVIIGFLTIILLPKENTKSSSGAFFKPWLTSLAILIITMLFNIEGSICWIMIYPLFSILAGIGGVIAYHFRKPRTNDPDKNNWENQNTLNVSFILLIPIVVGLLEGDRTLTPKEFNISKSVIISASPKEVWHELTNINYISTNENKFSFSNMMGFPKHLRTTLDTFFWWGQKKKKKKKK